MAISGTLVRIPTAVTSYPFFAGPAACWGLIPTRNPPKLSQTPHPPKGGVWYPSSDTKPTRQRGRWGGRNRIIAIYLFIGPSTILLSFYIGFHSLSLFILQINSFQTITGGIPPEN